MIFMKLKTNTTFIFIIVALQLLCSAMTNAAPPETTPGKKAAHQRYIVVFKPGTDSKKKSDELTKSHGLGLHHRYSHALNGMAATIPKGKLEALKNDPNVLYVEPDHIVKLYAQTMPTGINRVEADINPTASIDNTNNPLDVDIAIIDTGIDPNHSDLNLFKFINCPSTASCTEITTSDPNAKDAQGHGTHVAGTAAAYDNNRGVVGVAPGARLWALRVFDDAGLSYSSQVISAIDYVKANANQIEVANISLGFIR